MGGEDELQQKFGRIGATDSPSARRLSVVRWWGSCPGVAVACRGLMMRCRVLRCRFGGWVARWGEPDLFQLAEKDRDPVPRNARCAILELRVVTSHYRSTRTAMMGYSDDERSASSSLYSPIMDRSPNSLRSQDLRRRISKILGAEREKKGNACRCRLVLQRKSCIATPKRPAPRNSDNSADVSESAPNPSSHASKGVRSRRPDVRSR